MAVKPASGEEGSFRFVLDGPKKISLKFNVQAVLPSLVAEAELHVGEHIKMQKNSCCSEWMDVAELVKSKDIRISNGLGKDVGEDFRRHMAAEERVMKANPDGAQVPVWKCPPKRRNDLFVCMCYQAMVAHMAGLIGAVDITPSAEESHE